MADLSDCRWTAPQSQSCHPGLLPFLLSCETSLTSTHMAPLPTHDAGAVAQPPPTATAAAAASEQPATSYDQDVKAGIALFRSMLSNIDASGQQPDWEPLRGRPGKTQLLACLRRSCRRGARQAARRSRRSALRIAHCLHPILAKQASAWNPPAGTAWQRWLQTAAPKRWACSAAPRYRCGMPWLGGSCACLAALILIPCPCAVTARPAVQLHTC